MSDTQICQYCGATIMADADTCIMCGSPTTPPPPPAYTAPEAETSVEQPTVLEGEVIGPAKTAEEAYPPPPAQAYQAPEPVQTPSNRGLAVVAEIAAGIFGFLGIGWMISGRIGLGIGLLIGYWIFIAVYAITLVALSTLTGGISFFGFCCMPIFPVLSGLILYSQKK